MATWADLKEYIRNNYKISDEGPDTVAMLFDVGGLRSQMAIVSRTTFSSGSDEEWFSIESPIGKLGEIDLGAALDRVSNIVAGGLSLTGEHVVLKHSAPLINLDVNEFTRPLQLILASADDLEKALVGGDRY